MTGDDARDTFTTGYVMGRRHGYEIATTELLRILQERMKAGQDILPLLPLVDDLRERQRGAVGGESS
jgi:hypothetical protein